MREYFASGCTGEPVACILPVRGIVKYCARLFVERSGKGMNMIRFGLLGCGRIGQVHARSITRSARATVAAVADAQPAAAQNLADATRSSVMSIDEILQSNNVDAVIICTPTDTHADLIEAGAKAGKTVLCEKPVSLSANRIRECLGAIANTPTPLMIGFNRRFDPNFSAVERRIREGTIGDIETVTITSRDPSPPTAEYVSRSGGLFRDMMIHDLDLARFLLGEEPTEVHALGSALIDPAIRAAGDVDTALVMLKTKSGKLCQISCSRRATYGYDQRIEVLGSKGMLRAGNLHETTVELANAAGFQTDPLLNFFLERCVEAFRLELDHFIDCVENGVAPSPSLLDGLRAQVLADAATDAMQHGAPVTVKS